TGAEALVSVGGQHRKASNARNFVAFMDQPGRRDGGAVIGGGEEVEGGRIFFIHLQIFRHSLFLHKHAVSNPLENILVFAPVSGADDGGHSSSSSKYRLP